ncbi:MAG: beta-propeller domain-containing protein [Thiothrix sp.]|nr:beta-propeller domain-containing protein [Thiothrix sp.]
MQPADAREGGADCGRACIRLESVPADRMTRYLKQKLLDAYGQPVTESATYYAAGNEAAGMLSDAGNATAALLPGNVQEAGVDEPGRLRVGDGYLLTAGVRQARLDVWRLAPDGEALALSRLVLPTDTEVPLSGLYLLPEQHRVVGLAGDGLRAGLPQAFWFGADFWRERRTRLFGIDLRQPKQPRLDAVLELDGQLVSSRRQGAVVYLAMRQTLFVPGMSARPETAREAEANRQLIQHAALSGLAPRYRLGSDERKVLVEPASCLMPASEWQLGVPDLISLVAVDYSRAEPLLRARCFIGHAETLYLSGRAMYLATTTRPYTVHPDHVQYAADATTDLHKFALNGMTVDYRGSARIPGHLGREQHDKPWRMSEYQGVLRVISSGGHTVGQSQSPASLQVLAENGAQGLALLAALPDSRHPEPLGKVGEQVRAVRFAGQQGFLSTFRYTDPLYLLDLSVPAEPRVAGALELEGYFDYLHPLNERYLLGVGRRVVPDTGGLAGTAMGWEQGVRVVLIDVGNPQAPFETAALELGRRGSRTAVSASHRAFASRVQGGVMQIALPVSVHETPNGYQTPDRADPAYDWAWSRDELVRLEVDLNRGGLVQLPALVAARQAASPEARAWFYRSPEWQQDRSVFVKDHVYYLHEDKVLSLSW